MIQNRPARGFDFDSTPHTRDAAMTTSSATRVVDAAWTRENLARVMRVVASGRGMTRADDARCRERALEGARAMATNDDDDDDDDDAYGIVARACCEAMMRTCDDGDDDADEDEGEGGGEGEETETWLGTLCATASTSGRALERALEATRRAAAMDERFTDARVRRVRRERASVRGREGCDAGGVDRGESVGTRARGERERERRRASAESVRCEIVGEHGEIRARGGERKRRARIASDRAQGLGDLRGHSRRVVVSAVDGRSNARGASRARGDCPDGHRRRTSRECRVKFSERLNTYRS